MPGFVDLYWFAVLTLFCYSLRFQLRDVFIALVVLILLSAICWQHGWNMVCPAGQFAVAGNPPTCQGLFFVLVLLALIFENQRVPLTARRVRMPLSLPAHRALPLLSCLPVVRVSHWNFLQ